MQVYIPTGALAVRKSEMSNSVRDSLNAISIVERLSLELQSLHASDRFHGRIQYQTIMDSPAGSEPTLPEPAEQVEFNGKAVDRELLPPELWLCESLRLPTRLRAAREILNASGISCDPVRVDVYQLTTLLLRLITGEPLASYLSIPEVRARVHPRLRKVIDQVVGADNQDPQISLMQLQQEFGELRRCLDQQDLQARELEEQQRQGNQLPTDDIVANSMPLPPAADLPLHSPDDSLPFDHLAHYQVKSRIGSGGMGDLYLGYDPILDRQVALKVLPAIFSREPGFVDRFRHESASAARLHHPNIVPVFFAGEDAGHFFFAMQYVQGESLSELLARRHVLPIDECVTLIQQALSGLAHAHEHGMVHRDIKPGNLLIDHRLRRLMLGDFGLVKSLQSIRSITVTGTVMGTADYISPEQGKGQEVDHRSDLYSLGVVMYQLLSGRLPFTAGNASAMIFQHVYESPKPLASISPEIPAPLSNIVDRMLAKSPNDRYASAEEVLSDLQQFRSGRPISNTDGFSPRDAESGPQSHARPVVDAIPLRSSSELNSPMSSLVLAPVFPDAPEPPASTEGTAHQRWWNRVRERAAGMLGRASSERFQQLQNTQQQVDGAVEEYEHRQSVLGAHVQEAEAALQELRAQLDAWREAEHDANRRIDSASCESERRTAQQEKERCENTSRELRQEIEFQQVELDDMQVRFSQVTLKLGQLRNQRDLLSARLRIAEAQVRMLGQPTVSQPHRNWRRMAYNTACLTVFGYAAWFFISTVSPQWLTKDATAEIKKPAKTSPGDEGRFASEFMVGRESLLDFDASCTAIRPVFTHSNQSGFSFACGGDDGILRIGSVDTGSANAMSFNTSWLKEFFGHRNSITAIAFGHDGKWIASGDKSGEIRIWNDAAAKGSELSRVLVGHSSRIKGLKFSSDSTQLLSFDQDDTIRLWDVLHERELKMIQKVPLSQGVTPLALADGGTKMIASRGLVGAEGFGSWGLHGVLTCLRFSETGLVEESYDLSQRPESSVDFEIHWWDLSNPESGQAAGKQIYQVALSDDRRIALSLESGLILSTWDLARNGSRQQVSNIDKSKNFAAARFNTLAITSDGNYGITTTSDRGLQIWKLPRPPASEAQIARYDMQDDLNVVRFGSDGMSVAVGGSKGIKLWQLDKEWDPSKYPERINVGQPITALSPTRDGNGFAYATGRPRSHGNVLGVKYDRRWINNYLEGYTDVECLGHTDTITGVSMLKNESVLLSGSRDATMRLWSVETGTQIASIDVGVPINCVAVSPNERQALVATDDNFIRLYDLESMIEVQQLVGHELPVLDVHWPAKGNFFVSASVDKTIRIWDSTTFEATQVLHGHEDRVNSVSILDFGNTVVSGSDDNTVRYWDVAAGKEIAVFRGHSQAVLSVAVNPFGTRAVSASRDRSVRVWNLDSMQH